MYVATCDEVIESIMKGIFLKSDAAVIIAPGCFSVGPTASMIKVACYIIW